MRYNKVRLATSQRNPRAYCDGTKQLDGRRAPTGLSKHLQARRARVVNKPQLLAARSVETWGEKPPLSLMQSHGARRYRQRSIQALGRLVVLPATADLTRTADRQAKASEVPEPGVVSKKKPLRRAGVGPAREVCSQPCPALYKSVGPPCLLAGKAHCDLNTPCTVKSVWVGAVGR